MKPITGSSETMAMHAMTIDPRDLGRGRYVVELAITDRRGRRAMVSREILID